jgi:hypothetical protein
VRTIGYLADIYFLDGITPSTTTRVVNGVTETILTTFGEFDANGIWQPKAYTGSYGTNGFHLPILRITAQQPPPHSGRTLLATAITGRPITSAVTAGAGNDIIGRLPH